MFWKKVRQTVRTRPVKASIGFKALIMGKHPPSMPNTCDVTLETIDGEPGWLALTDVSGFATWVGEKSVKGFKKMMKACNFIVHHKSTGELIAGDNERSLVQKASDAVLYIKHPMLDYTNLESITRDLIDTNVKAVASLGVKTEHSKYKEYIMPAMIFCLRKVVWVLATVCIGGKLYEWWSSSLEGEEKICYSQADALEWMDTTTTAAKAFLSRLYKKSIAIGGGSVTDSFERKAVLGGPARNPKDSEEFQVTAKADNCNEYGVVEPAPSNADIEPFNLPEIKQPSKFNSLVDESKMCEYLEECEEEGGTALIRSQHNLHWEEITPEEGEKLKDEEFDRMFCPDLDSDYESDNYSEYTGTGECQCGLCDMCEYDSF